MSDKKNTRHYVTARLTTTITIEVLASNPDEAVQEARQRVASMELHPTDFDLHILYTQDTDGTYRQGEQHESE